MKPHKCPVCDGKCECSIDCSDGTAVVVHTFPCAACSRTGIVWEPDSFEQYCTQKQKCSRCSLEDRCTFGSMPKVKTDG